MLRIMTVCVQNAREGTSTAGLELFQITHSHKVGVGHVTTYLSLA